jgi:hypothetical protein
MADTRGRQHSKDVYRRARRALRKIRRFKMSGKAAETFKQHELRKIWERA